MPRLLTLCILLLIPHLLPAQWHSLENLDVYRREGTQGLLLRSGPAAMSVRFLSDNLVRVRVAPGGTFERDSSWAVVMHDSAAVAVTFADSSDVLSLASASLRLVVRKRPLRVIFEDHSGAVLNEDHPGKGMAWSGDEVRVWKVRPQDEHYYGFGEKAGRLERAETHTTMWNTDIPAYAADTDPLYQSIPFFLALRHGRAYGIFFDNSYRSSFDMGKEARDQYSFGAQGGELNYYFINGPLPQEVSARFANLVGHMPLPPRWALGYQQSRWSYSPEARVRAIARGFRERNIPCDVLYLDIDYMDGYRIFTWNPKNFPDPRRMVTDLTQNGFHVAVIVDPGIKVDTAYPAYRTGLAGGHFVRYPDGRVYTGKVWPGVCAFPDFTSAAARTWWGAQFSGLAAAGVRGWWNDMNEPSVFDVPTKTMDLTVLHEGGGRTITHAGAHNIYGMQMTRATYDGVRRLLPEERPFVLTRASYAGGHRYSAAWTGDNVASWEHVRMALAMCLNLSISGQPFVGSDIGGFIGYPGGELFARWLQLGVFTPLMRAHSVINERNKEPWEYGDEYTAINRETINLRYRLLPYIYTVMEEASTTGVPAMRPLAYAFPGQEQRYWNEQSLFMFGKDLLVAPVLWEGARSRELTPPDGRWYELTSGRKIDGGRSVTIDAGLGTLPVLVRAGAVIPSQQVMQFVGQAPVNPLTLTAFPCIDGESDTSAYYEDDGLTFGYQRGKYLRRTFLQSSSPGARTLTASSCDGGYVPSDRDVLVQFAASAEPRSVTLNTFALTAAAPGTALPPRTWRYEAARQMVSIRLPDTRAAFRVEVHY